MKQENEKLEFKRQVSDTIIKEVVAFANTDGGTIIIGYDDDGKIIGLNNPKQELDKLNNKLHDSIEPDVSFLLSERIEKQEGKEVIVLEVLKGTNKPYYIRVGSTCQPATSYSIRDFD